MPLLSDSPFFYCYPARIGDRQLFGGSQRVLGTIKRRILLEEISLFAR